MPTIKKRAYAAKKQPEQEIVTLAAQMREYLAPYKKIITGAAFVLAVVLLIAAGFSYKRSSDEQKAGALFADAYAVYSGGTAADFTKALDLFRAVQKKYSSAKTGLIAQYYAGNCLMNLGRNEDALKEYQSFMQEHSGDKFLTGLVYTRLGYLYDEQGNRAEAIKAFEQADKLVGPGASTLELAKLYEASGNTAASQQKYKIIADKLSGTAWAMEAMAKVQKIQAPVSAAGTSSK